ncbi:MAG: beta strand repeat-containing protein, partial [Pirellulales bacterium]
MDPTAIVGSVTDDAGNEADFSGATPPTTTDVLVNTAAATVVTPSADGTYKTGDVLTLSVAFNEAVTVDDSVGIPQIELLIGGETKNALYTSGTGSSTLIFTYAIEADLEDTDGIDVTGVIGLNSGTIQNADGINAELTFTPPPNNINIDSVAPTVSGAVAVPGSGTYNTGDVLTFTVTFDEVVNSTNATLPLTIGSNTRSAALATPSGTGTTTLLFEYTIAADDRDSNGIAVDPTAIVGSVTDDAGNQADFSTATSQSTAGVLVNAAVITSVTLNNSNGTYKTGDVLTLNVAFSEEVTVGGVGTPQIGLTIGSNIGFADYDNGSGTTALVFNYTVQTDDLDADGIAVVSPISLNGGTIEDANTNDAILTFTPPTTTGVLVDAVAPVADAVTPPPAGSYATGQTLSFDVVFDGNVDVIGTPSLPLDIGGTTRAAAYVSGTGTDTLTFEYTILSTDQDVDGITVDPSSITAGVFDAAGNAATYAAVPVPSTAGVFVNEAVINSVTASANGDYEVGDTITLTATFSQPVDVNTNTLTTIPTIGLAIGSNPRQAAFVSGDGTSILVFEYEVQVGDLDADGIEVASPVNLNGGTIQDLDTNDAALAFTPPTTTGILVKTAELQSVTVSDGTYATDDVISLTATFDSVVTVGGAGTPRIALTIGSASVFADYDTGSGTTALVFNYTVQTDDLDADGIAVNAPILLNGGTIEDAGGNDAILTFTPPTTTGVLVDAVAPVALAVTPPPAGAYVTGQTLSFDVVFDGNVDVIGTPSLELNIGGTTRAAAYVSGTGTDTLTFEYTILSTDQDGDGITVDPSSITAGVFDAAGNAATYAAVPVPSTAGVFVNAAVINSVTASANGDYRLGDRILFTVTFSQPVDVTMPDAVNNRPFIGLTIGSLGRPAAFVSGEGTSILVFEYVVQAGDLDPDGIEVAGPIFLNGGTIQDLDTNDAVLAFTPPTDIGILVDAEGPSLPTLITPSAGTYLTGDTLTFNLVFAEPVQVTGNPRIPLEIGTNSPGGTPVDRLAIMSAGAGTDTLTFEYVIQTTDHDIDGLGINSPVDGLITDAFGNGANLAIPSLSEPGIRINPTKITALTASADGDYITGQNIDFTVVFSEAVNVVGTPSIELLVGNTPISADYLQGSGTDTLVFRYTVDVNDVDEDGITLVTNTVDLGDPVDSSIVAVSDGGEAILTFAPPVTSGVTVNAVPRITLVSTTTPDGAYDIDDVIDIQVTTSLPVKVTDAGNAKLELNTGIAGTDFATFIGSANVFTNTLVFQYIVQDGDYTADLDYLAIDS